MDYSKQSEVFVPQNFTHDVHVVGCGATGSWVAMLLAKLGVQNVHLHDFDKVEEHNIPNQLFQYKQIGELKVHGMMENIMEYSLVAPECHHGAVTGATPLTGVVFVLTDTMHSRTDIYKKALKNNIQVPLFIETRMGTEGGRIYTVDPCNKKQTKGYAATLYTDEQASVSACGVSQSLAPTAAMIASMAVWQMLKWHTGAEITNEIIIDAKHDTYLTRNFK